MFRRQWQEELRHASCSGSSQQRQQEQKETEVGIHMIIGPSIIALLYCCIEHRQLVCIGWEWQQREVGTHTQVRSSLNYLKLLWYTVKPSNNGHVGDERFVHCAEVVRSSVVEMYEQYIGRGEQLKFVNCREFVHSSECRLLGYWRFHCIFTASCYPSSALIYYRQAVQLVPDIEYRVHSKDTPRHMREDGEKL